MIQTEEDDSAIPLAFSTSSFATDDDYNSTDEEFDEIFGGLIDQAAPTIGETGPAIDAEHEELFKNFPTPKAGQIRRFATKPIA